MKTQKPYFPILVTAILSSAIIFIGAYVLMMTSMFDLKILFAFFIVSAVISTAIGYTILKKTCLNKVDNFLASSSKIVGKEYEHCDGELFDTVISDIERMKKDEDFLKIYKKEVSGTFGELHTIFKSLENGDFTIRADTNRKHNALQVTTNNAIINVATMVNDLKKQIEYLNTELLKAKEDLVRAEETSEQVADAASQVATAAADQSAKLQDVSDQLEATSGITTAVTNAAEDTVVAASEIEENSEIGVKKVENAIETMQGITTVIENLGKAIQELGDESKKINEVTVLIKDVAEQTGLLALNASIEAARAGDAGKGFAVVASEIKSLAEEIKKSVEDINRTINGVNRKVEATINLGISGRDEVDKGVIAIDEVNGAFLKIRESVGTTSEKITSIKINAEKAANNVENALRNAQDIASISEEFAATAEELTASAEEQSRIMNEIDNAIEQITSSSEKISNDVSKFKTK